MPQPSAPFLFRRIRGQPKAPLDAYQRGFFIVACDVVAGVYCQDNGLKGSRTPDLCNANAALYQLSYEPVVWALPL